MNAMARNPGRECTIIKKGCPDVAGQPAETDDHKSSVLLIIFQKPATGC